MLSPRAAQVRLLSDGREGKKPTGCRENQNEHRREEGKCFTERKILSAYQKEDGVVT